jgi:hypothetical protein
MSLRIRLKALPVARLLRQAGWFLLSYVLFLSALFVMYLVLHCL